jgi:putative PIN family toxin of toxin-antitoxin system
MARPAVVLDTNVVVSAFLSRVGLERRVLDLALARHLRFCMSDEIPLEYSEVLARPKFSIEPADLAASMTAIRQSAVRFVPSLRAYAAVHPEDHKFLECAQAARADYLVTGNLRHFPKTWKSTRVVNARQFIAELIPSLEG